MLALSWCAYLCTSSHPHTLLARIASHTLTTLIFHLLATTHYPGSIGHNRQIGVLTVIIPVASSYLTVGLNVIVYTVEHVPKPLTMVKELRCEYGYSQFKACCCSLLLPVILQFKTAKHFASSHVTKFAKVCKVTIMLIFFILTTESPRVDVGTWVAVGAEVPQKYSGN